MVLVNMYYAECGTGEYQRITATSDMIVELHFTVQLRKPDSQALEGKGVTFKGLVKTGILT